MDEPLQTTCDPRAAGEGANNRQLWRRVSAHRVMRMTEPQDDEYDTKEDYSVGDIPKVTRDELRDVLP